MLRVLRDFPENFLNIFSHAPRACARHLCDSFILSFFIYYYGSLAIQLRFSCDSLAVQLRFTCGSVAVHLRRSWGAFAVQVAIQFVRARSAKPIADRHDRCASIRRSIPQRP